jgi:peptidoglycan-associated lipoprotein
MPIHFVRITAVAALVLTAAIAGCARRPMLTAVSTPAPAAPSAEPRPTEGQAPSTVIAEQGSQAMVSAAIARPAPAEFTERAELKNVYFDFDRYDIRPEDTKTLESTAAWLKSHDVLVLIEGQCDERGTDAYNLALGDRRASAAKRYLVAHGIAADRITTLSMGKERPVCAAHSEACWAQNRRAHFLVKPRE